MLQVFLLAEIFDVLFFFVQKFGYFSVHIYIKSSPNTNSGLIVFIILAGFPATTLYGGTSLTTTLPPPMTDHFPILRRGRTVAPTPKKTPSSTVMHPARRQPGARKT